MKINSTSVTSCAFPLKLVQIQVAIDDKFGGNARDAIGKNTVDKGPPFVT